MMTGVLDIFTVPTTDVSLASYRMSEVSQEGSGIVPMVFRSRGVEEFVDLSRSYFRFEISLTSDNPTNKGFYADGQGTGQAADQSGDDYTKYIYPVNNFAHSIIRQMNLRFNGTLLSPQTDMYAYKAYIETLLNYTRAEGETLLAPQGWKNMVNVGPSLAATSATNDKPAAARTKWVSATDNPLKQLGGLLKQNQTATFIMKPHLEAFHTGRLLVPFTDIIFEIFFNSPDFFMFGTTIATKKNILLKAENIKGWFHMCRVGLNPSVYNSLRDQMQSTDGPRKIAAYPTVRSELRSLGFEGNSTKFIQDNLFFGRVPDRVIVGLLDTRAFNGTVNYYPFAFQKFGVTNIK